LDLDFDFFDFFDFDFFDLDFDFDFFDFDFFDLDFDFFAIARGKVGRRAGEWYPIDLRANETHLILL